MNKFALFPPIASSEIRDHRRYNSMTNNKQDVNASKKTAISEKSSYLCLCCHVSLFNVSKDVELVSFAYLMKLACYQK